MMIASPLPLSPSMAVLHCHLCDNETFQRQEDLLKHFALGHFYQELLGKEEEYYHIKGGRRPYYCISNTHICRYHTSDEEKMMLHIAVEHNVIVDILEDKENEMLLKSRFDSEKQRTKNKTSAEKSKMSKWVKDQWVVKQCAEEMISVAYLERRWRRSSNQIKASVAAAGLRVPKQNRAAIYPENPFRPKN